MKREGLSTVYWYECDNAECDECTEAFEMPFRAQQDGARAGWLWDEVNDKHYCPHCRRTVEEE